MRRRSLMLVAALALLGGLQWLASGQQPAGPQAERPRLAALRQERVTLARQAIEVLDRQRDNGTGGELAEYAEWERRLFDAETQAAADKAGRVAAAERYVASTRKRAERAQQLYQIGNVPMGDVLRVKYELAGAECALEELKAQ